MASVWSILLSLSITRGVDHGLRANVAPVPLRAVTAVSVICCISHLPNTRHWRKPFARLPTSRHCHWVTDQLRPMRPPSGGIGHLLSRMMIWTRLAADQDTDVNIKLPTLAPSGCGGKGAALVWSISLSITRGVDHGLRADAVPSRLRSATGEFATPCMSSPQESDISRYSWHAPTPRTPPP